MTDNEALQAHVNAIKPGTPEAADAVIKLEQTLVLCEATLEKFTGDRQEAVRYFRESMTSADQEVREEATSDLNKKNSAIDAQVAELNQRTAFAKTALARLSK